MTNATPMLTGAEDGFQRSPKLADRAVQVVGQRLVASADAEATAMPSESELAAAFAVSRTVAREVVQTLARLGMVDVSQGKRMKVRPREDWDYLNPTLLEFFDDPEEVRHILTELHETRVLIEPAVAERAALLADDDQRKALAAEVEEMRNLLDDAPAFVRHDVAFHAILADAAQNRFVRRIIQTSRELLVVSHMKTTTMAHTLSTALEHHSRICDAVLDRDPERARREMEIHLDFGLQFWLGTIS